MEIESLLGNRTKLVFLSLDKKDIKDNSEIDSDFKDKTVFIKLLLYKLEIKSQHGDRTELLFLSLIIKDIIK